MGAALKVEHLVKSYGRRRVVDQVSFQLSQGEIIGLLGPNGAGKTTTFHIIVGLIAAEKGKIFLDNKEISSLPMYLRARQGLSYLPQESSIFQGLTVEENILAILETLALNKEERKERCASLLEDLGISRLARHKAYTLSGGERRRVEIARALVISPLFLLLDEPFTGIDPISIFDIQEIIHGLKLKGIGVLITDHNVRETLKITDRAYIIHEGKILVSGNAEDLIHNERAREIYLGEKFTL